MSRTGTDRIHRTVIRITVLSEGPMGDGMSLDQIERAMDQGEYVGSMEQVSVEALEDHQVEEATVAVGSDPSFFGSPEG